MAAVAQRDDEDGPLAHLAILLAPCVVLTGDGDLTHHGIGQDDWLATILLLKRLSELDAALWGGSRFAGLALYPPALAVGSAGRFLLQSELALGATIGMAIGAVLYLRPRLRAARASGWARVGPVLERAAELIAQGIELRAQADAALQPRLLTATAPPTAEQAAARLLAERWEPMSSVGIHAELVRRGHEGSLAATRALLREHPSFVPVPGRGFQLGRSFGAH